MEDAVHTATHDDLSVVHVAGELDVYMATSLRDELARLIAADDRDVLVDLTRVTFMDSTGLGVLIGAMKRLQSVRRQMELAVDDERVLRVLRIAGLSRVFEVHRSVDDALARNR